MQTYAKTGIKSRNSYHQNQEVSGWKAQINQNLIYIYFDTHEGLSQSEEKKNNYSFLIEKDLREC